MSRLNPPEASMSGSTPPLTIDSPDPARRRFLQIAGQIAGAGLVAAPVAGSLLGASSSPVEAAQQSQQQSQRAAMPPASVTGRPMPQIQKPFPLPPQSRSAMQSSGWASSRSTRSFRPSRIRNGRSWWRWSAATGRRPSRSPGVMGSIGRRSTTTPDSTAYRQPGNGRRLHHPAQGLHAEYAIRAAKAGKHVMCEKPMASTVGGVRSDDRASLRAGRKLMVAYRAQYEPFNLEAIGLPIPATWAS